MSLPFFKTDKAKYPYEELSPIYKNLFQIEAVVSDTEMLNQIWAWKTDKGKLFLTFNLNATLLNRTLDVIKEIHSILIKFHSSSGIITDELSLYVDYKYYKIDANYGSILELVGIAAVYDIITV